MRRGQGVQREHNGGGGSRSSCGWSGKVGTRTLELRLGIEDRVGQVGARAFWEWVTLCAKAERSCVLGTEGDTRFSEHCELRQEKVTESCRGW